MRTSFKRALILLGAIVALSAFAMPEDPVEAMARDAQPIDAELVARMTLEVSQMTGRPIRDELPRVVIVDGATMCEAYAGQRDCGVMGMYWRKQNIVMLSSWQAELGNPLKEKVTLAILAHELTHFLQRNETWAAGRPCIDQETEAYAVGAMYAEQRLGIRVSMPDAFNIWARCTPAN